MARGGELELSGVRMGLPRRLHARPRQLLWSAMGPPWVFAWKLARLVAMLARYGRDTVVGPKLERLHELGLIERVPTRLQRMVGSFDMLRRLLP